MADSGPAVQEAEPAQVTDEPSTVSETVKETQKEQEGASVADKMAASELAVAAEGDAVNPEGEEQAQAEQEQEGSREQAVEDDAVAGEDQSKGDSVTGDGEMGAQIKESPLEQDPAVEPGSEMGGGPKARETDQEGKDGDGGEEEGPPVGKELDGPSAGIEPPAVEEQGGDARDEGGDVKDEGSDAREQDGDAKHEGGDLKDEGDTVKAEVEGAKDDGVMKAEGEMVKDEAMDEAVGYESLEEEVGLSREEIIAHLREALATQEQLKAVNAQYQHKIAEYLAKKKTEEKHDPTRSVTDQEQRYAKCMNALEALQLEYTAMAEKQCQEEAELVAESQDCLGLVDEQRKEHLSFCKQKSIASVYTRTGRHMTAQEFEQLAAEDRKGEGDVVQTRLENIRLSTSIAKKEALIRKKEELGEGLHVIDFEQLKIDNVNLNEKIEERNEDLVKLRKKITGTVQVLTHVKEKLQFVQAENAERKERLTALEQSLALKRDRLTRLKQARDALRMDNIKLRHQGGLVGHLDLLRDFEEQVDKNDVAASVIQSHQQQQSEVLLASNRLQQKEATAAAWTQRGMV